VGPTCAKVCSASWPRSVPLSPPRTDSSPSSRQRCAYLMKTRFCIYVYYTRISIRIYIHVYIYTTGSSSAKNGLVAIKPAKARLFNEDADVYLCIVYKYICICVYLYVHMCTYIHIYINDRFLYPLQERPRRHRAGKGALTEFTEERTRFYVYYEVYVYINININIYIYIYKYINKYINKYIIYIYMYTYIHKHRYIGVDG